MDEEIIAYVAVPYTALSASFLGASSVGEQIDPYVKDVMLLGSDLYGGAVICSSHVASLPQTVDKAAKMWYNIY